MATSCWWAAVRWPEPAFRWPPVAMLVRLALWSLICASVMVCSATKRQRRQPDRNRVACAVLTICRAILDASAAAICQPARAMCDCNEVSMRPGRLPMVFGRRVERKTQPCLTEASQEAIMHSGRQSSDNRRHLRSPVRTDGGLFLQHLYQSPQRPMESLCLALMRSRR